MRTIALTLVRPTKEITVGAKYCSNDIAGFKPEIAANLVRCGLAVYVDADGHPAAEPVHVTVELPSIRIHDAAEKGMAT